MENQISRKKWYIVIAAAAAALLLGFSVFALRRGLAERKREDALRFSEISTAESFCLDGGICSWAELYNSEGEDMDISGFSLSLGDGQNFAFPEGSLIPAEGYLLVHFGGGCGGTCTVPFSLPAEDGGTLTFSNRRGRQVDSAELPKAETGRSFLREGDGWTVCDAPSPGFENSEAGQREYRELIRQGADSLRISELMVKNHAVYQAADGSFPDWVEIENLSQAPVELGGWSLSDQEGSYGFTLPSVTLEAGQRLLILADGKPSTEEIHVDFSLSYGETVFLYNPYGVLADSMLCDTDTADHAMARREDGSAAETSWATPGYANTREGYEEYSGTQRTSSPLIINEVMVSNQSYLYQKDIGYCDWVELKNVSDHGVELSDYWLSDDEDDYFQWQLPQKSLAPGELTIVYCSNDVVDATRSGFSLDANEEELFLCTEKGMADWVSLHDVPVNGSMGRLEGEEGFFYFSVPSPGKNNAGGCRFVSERPEAVTPDGVYEEVDTLQVELSGLGTIYYTLDGSVPTINSRIYDGPIPVSETTVIRAVAVEENAVPSRVRTLSYVVNEGHTLPVLSLVTDNSGAFTSMYNESRKNKEVPGSISLYENGEGFTIACGISMKGWTSLSLPKKSMGVSFRGCYGDGDLEYDVFGNGIDRYSSLSIRAGQDYPEAMIRNELFQSLCLEMTDHVMTQESKYCVLYINGKYHGIYSLKEDLTRQYYASHTGSSKDSVTMLKSSIRKSSELYQTVFEFCFSHNMTKEENYQHFCELFDVDSLIDWVLLEAYSANSDVNGNMRYFRSSENGGKWQIAFYDLDWTFRVPSNCFNNVIYPTRAVQIAPLIRVLLQNEDFAMRLAARCVELCGSTLSNRHVLEKIDELQELLAPEMERERRRWGSNVNAWLAEMDKLRDYINKYDYENYMLNRLFRILKLTEEQKALLTGTVP